jgi:cellulose synthase/poly-beta-1,6-N-acetylglucosamine synthase-like glycosyltransferase
MTASSLNRLPPVTFIVTGYNQADLIDAAIEGACAQNYPDLQIILTDDHSGDDTFARMQAAVAAYRGPHEMVASEVAQNQGTFGNIYDAFRQARGELIVFAGGDDISYPERTRVIAECWLESGADAFYSRYDVIDAAGQLIERDWKPTSDGLWLLDYFPGRSIDPLHGASMACHRSVLERHPADGVRIRSEDAYLTLMLALEAGRTDYIDRSLVRYRKHPGALTNETPPAPTRVAVAARERAQMSFAASQHDLLRLFRQRLDARGDVPAAVVPLLRDDLHLFGLRARWDRSSFAERLRALPAARRRRHLDWLLPRLGGFAAFTRVKAAALRRRGA